MTSPDCPCCASAARTCCARWPCCLNSRYPPLGYVQGFNHIAWQLCAQHRDDWRVFQLMCHLLEGVHGLDYFEGMRGLLADLAALAVVARDRFPRLLARLQRWELSLDAVLTTWLVCFFAAGRLSLAAKARLLEHVIAGGRRALLQLVLLGLERLCRSTSSKQTLEQLAESIRGAERCFEDGDWPAKAARVVLPPSLADIPPRFFLLAADLDLRAQLRPLHFQEERPRSSPEPRKTGSLLQLRAREPL